MPTLQNDNISIPIANVQLVQIQSWKMWKPGVVDVSINFRGIGLYDSDWETYINAFLSKRGQPADGVVVSVDGIDLVFADKGLQAGSIKSRTGSFDRLIFRISFKEGDLALQELLADLLPLLGGFTQSGRETSFYDVVYFLGNPQ
jgi:hypothetical protein